MIFPWTWIVVTAQPTVNMCVIPPHNWIAKIVRNNRIGLVVKFQLVIDNDTQIINGDIKSGFH